MEQLSVQPLVNYELARKISYLRSIVRLRLKPMKKEKERKKEKKKRIFRCSGPVKNSHGHVERLRGSIAKNIKIDAAMAEDRKKSIILACRRGLRSRGVEESKSNAAEERAQAHTMCAAYKSALRIFRHFLLLTRYNLN